MGDALIYPNELKSDNQISMAQLQSNPNSSNSCNSLQRDSTNQGNMSSDWSLGEGSNNSSDSAKLDLLSNAALSFRTPFLQECRTMDEHMQENEKPVLVVNGKLKMKKPYLRPQSTFTFKGQMV